MTIAAMLLSIVVGTVSLAYGYSQAGLNNPSRWLLILGVIWIVAHWRKNYWFSSAALFITLIAAAYGVWNGFTTIWMLVGALGGLLGWDLSDFARRLTFAARTDDVQGMERRHLERVGIVAALGLGLALLSLYVRIQRLAFEVAVGLILLAALGLTRLIVGLRKY